LTIEDTVVTTRDGRVGRILLNRPKALNALDLSIDPSVCGPFWRRGVKIPMSMPW